MARTNPLAIPADTSPDVWALQMAAIRARPPAERLAEWEAFNRDPAEREAAAVRRRHPDYDDATVIRALVRSRYGDDLARAVWPGLALVDP